MSEINPQAAAFLADLRELCIKHKVQIWACSCCGGLNIYDADHNQLYPPDGPDQEFEMDGTGRAECKTCALLP